MLTYSGQIRLNGQRTGTIRVSPFEQNPERQLERRLSAPLPAPFQEHDA